MTTDTSTPPAPSFQRITPSPCPISVAQFQSNVQEYHAQREALLKKRQEWLERKRNTPPAAENGVANQLSTIAARCQLDQRFLLASACFVDPIVFERLKKADTVQLAKTNAIIPIRSRGTVQRLNRKPAAIRTGLSSLAEAPPSQKRPRKSLTVQKPTENTEQGGSSADGTNSPADPTIDETGVAPSTTRFDRQVKEIHDRITQSPLVSLKEQNHVTLPAHLKPEINYIISGAGLTGRTTTDIATSATGQHRLTKGKLLVKDRSSELVPVDPHDVVLSVTLYDAGLKTSKMQSLLVLGSQPLTVLRDSMYCLLDFLTHSGRTKSTNTLTTKVSSSYFFIDKTFYIDDRDSNAIDYTLPIREWLQKEDRLHDPKFSGIGEPRSMAQTHFRDLKLQLHTPYYFVHQGDCEHSLVFTDVRALRKSDDRNAATYPKLTFQCFLRRHKCRMCRMSPAEFVTIDDVYSGESPCFFCQNCYNLFHYDQEGKLLYEYQMFPYMTSSSSV
ncbi:hypothetical protein IWQ62_005635 [Dispira parvispora]|uniref:snRNA-activating protein complex subunit 3 n=1 Tax=Dispira parvispora TaxID=1520584 RepID=A0A9W8ALV2_9FUNG|nr:hypothetical protein IWQ62_005635 [Dispira parvispora]